MEFKLFVRVEDSEVFLHDQLFPRKISDALSSYLWYFPQIKLQPIQLNSDSSQKMEFTLPSFAMYSCCNLLFTFVMVIFLNKSVQCIQIIPENQLILQMKFKLIKINQAA